MVTVKADANDTIEISHYGDRSKTFDLFRIYKHDVICVRCQRRQSLRSSNPSLIILFASIIWLGLGFFIYDNMYIVGGSIVVMILSMIGASRDDYSSIPVTDFEFELKNGNIRCLTLENLALGEESKVTDAFRTTF